MKKILIAVLFAVGMFTTSSAQAQKVKYYYYPTANVYYNPAINQYAYVENGTWGWYNALPANTTVLAQRRVLVYHTADDVWMNNAAHASKYKTTPPPHGKAVGYKGTNPNKKSGNANGYKGTNPNKASGKATGHKGTNPNRQAGKTKVKQKG
jgi:hypothetical protein